VAGTNRKEVLALDPNGACRQEGATIHHHVAAGSSWVVSSRDRAFPAACKVLPAEEVPTPVEVPTLAALRGGGHRDTADQNLVEELLAGADPTWVAGREVAALVRAPTAGEGTWGQEDTFPEAPFWAAAQAPRRVVGAHETGQTAEEGDDNRAAPSVEVVLPH